MTRILLALAALLSSTLLCATAHAQMVTPPAAPSAVTFVAAAAGNALSFTDGTIGAASQAFSSAFASFGAGDVGKTLCLQGSGTSGATQCGTISAVADAHDVTVSFTSVGATPWFSVADAPLTIATDQSGAGSYAPADTITLTGGTATAQAQLAVASTELASATVNAGGTGGTNGACTVTGTTGTGIKFTASGTVTANALAGALTVTTGGIYTVNPTSLAAEPVTGCSLTGATLALKMGAHQVTLTSGGHYSVFPANPVSQGSTSGSGTGFQLTATQAQAGAGTRGGGVWVYGTDDTAALQAAAASATPAIYLDGSKGYLLNGSLTLQSNHSITGLNGRPILYQVAAGTARTLLFPGTVGAAASGLEIRNFGSLTDYLILLNGGATRNQLTDFLINDGPNFSTGTVNLSTAATFNTLSRFAMTRNAGTCIGFSGAGVQQNTVQDLQVTDCEGFGVRIGEGANRNQVIRARTTRNGIELVGVTFQSNWNSVSDSYAEGTGDNGFSFTGDYNVGRGLRAYHDAKAGIGIWGSFNSVDGVATGNNQIGDVSSSKWSGFWIANGFNACGDYNTVSGAADDDQTQRTQTFGVLFGGGGNAYTAWANGQVISSIGTLRFNGLNIYSSTNTGTTGASAPTCTSGTCSDGTVTWSYVNSCVQQVNAHDNLSSVTIGRSVAGGTVGSADSFTTNSAIGNRALSIPPNAAAGGVPIQFRNLPTSSTGLVSGQFWNNAGVVNVIP